MKLSTSNYGQLCTRVRGDASVDLLDKYVVDMHSIFILPTSVLTTTINDDNDNVKALTGANFIKRLKLSQRSICVRIKLKTDLSWLVKSAPALFVF